VLHSLDSYYSLSDMVPVLVYTSFRRLCYAEISRFIVVVAVHIVFALLMQLQALQSFKDVRFYSQILENRSPP